MEEFNQYQFVSSYLLPDEHILWKGHPEKGHLVTPGDLVTSVFGLFFFGFSLFWEFGAIQSGIPFMMIWGVPFVAVGFYLVIGRYIHKAYLRNKTFYVITNKKLIIRSGRRTTMYNAADLPPMTVQMHSNGNGTITFMDSYYGRRRRHVNYFALENLRDVVYAQQALSQMEH